VVKVVNTESISATLLIQHTLIGFSGKRLTSLLVMESPGDKPDMPTMTVEGRVDAASEAKMTSPFLTGQLGLAVVLRDTATDVVHVLLYETPIFVEDRADWIA